MTPDRRRNAANDRRRGMLADLERFVRRLVFLPLLLPVLLFAGAGMGRLAHDSMDVEDEHISLLSVADAPRIRFQALSGFLDRMTSTRSEGTETEDFLVVYRDHVAPVEQSLLERGVDADVARKVGWSLVEHSSLRSLDVATVLAVLLIESRGDPDATSFVGARGLMQVMPMHQGQWPGCGQDLYDIEDNLCMGTSILAWYLRVNRGNERRALLGYNGCVNGTNTPDCFSYPDKVSRIRAALRAEWRGRGVASGAAAP